MGRRPSAVVWVLCVYLVGSMAPGGVCSAAAPEGIDAPAPRQAARRAGTGPLPRTADAKTDSTLTRMMRTLRATTVPRRKPPSDRPGGPSAAPAKPSARPAVSAPTAAPTTRPAGNATTRPAKDTKANGSTAESPDALKKLENIAAMRGIPDLQALADAMFLAGRPKAAAILYQRVLEDTKGPKRTANTKARAWALYQLGNCYRSSDPAKAAEYFKRLYTDKEYGTSDFAVAAKAQADLIQWRQRNKPDDLIRQSVAKREAP